MAMQISLETYTGWVGYGVWEVQKTEYDARLRTIITANVWQYLPTKLYDRLQSDVPYGVELQAFYDDYVVPFICFALAQEWVLEVGLKPTPAGLRIIQEQFSQEAQNKQKADMSARLGSKKDLYAERMIMDWFDRNFLFDGISYPPQPNQNGWNGGYGYWSFFNNPRLTGFFGDGGGWNYGYPNARNGVNIGGNAFFTV